MPSVPLVLPLVKPELVVLAEVEIQTESGPVEVRRYQSDPRGVCRECSFCDAAKARDESYYCTPVKGGTLRLMRPG